MGACAFALALLGSAVRAHLRARCDKGVGTIKNQDRARFSRIALGTTAGALVAGLALSATAGATEYTGWQTNDGWNSLEGCSVYRDIRPDGVTATDLNLCGGDVGVKGQFRSGGSVYLLPWDWDSKAAGWIDPNADWKPLIRATHE